MYVVKFSVNQFDAILIIIVGATLKLIYLSHNAYIFLYALTDKNYHISYSIHDVWIIYFVYA